MRCVRGGWENESMLTGSIVVRSEAGLELVVEITSVVTKVVDF
jgi:hypothetical protein